VTKTERWWYLRAWRNTAEIIGVSATWIGNRSGGYRAAVESSSGEQRKGEKEGLGLVLYRPGGVR